MILYWSWISLPCLSRRVISLSWPISSAFFGLTQALWYHDRFSYDLLVEFPDVLSCFLFDGPAYICVLRSLFIVAVFHHFSSFRHQDLCWWRYPRFQWFVDCLSYSWHALLDHVCGSFLMVSMSSISCSVSNRFLNSSWNSIFFYPICVVSILGGILVINFSFPPLHPVWFGQQRRIVYGSQRDRLSTKTAEHDRIRQHHHEWHNAVEQQLFRATRHPQWYHTELRHRFHIFDTTTGSTCVLGQTAGCSNSPPQSQNKINEALIRNVFADDAAVGTHIQQELQSLMVRFSQTTMTSSWPSAWRRHTSWQRTQRHCQSSPSTTTNSTPSISLRTSAPPSPTTSPLQISTSGWGRQLQLWPASRLVCALAYSSQCLFLCLLATVTPRGLSFVTISCHLKLAP